MKLFFYIFTVIISFITWSCDPIYVQKTPPLVIKSDTFLSESLRVEGVKSLFPTLKNIYINTKEKRVKNELLVILFYKNEDLLAFKKNANQDNNTSIDSVKSKLDPKNSYYYLVQPSEIAPFVMTLQNVSVFEEGLWIVFYSNNTEQFIEVSLEFKRMGIKEIPKTKIVLVQ